MKKRVLLFDMIMIVVIKIQSYFSMSYYKVTKNEIYQMVKHDLEAYEVGQYMGGN